MSINPPIERLNHGGTADYLEMEKRRLAVYLQQERKYYFGDKNNPFFRAGILTLF